MPIRSYEEWEQAVLNRRLKEAETRLAEAIPEKVPPKPPPTLLEIWLWQLARLVAVLCVVGAVFLLLVQQFPERLEPVVSSVENIYLRLVR